VSDDPQRIVQELQRLGDRRRELRAAEREILDAVERLLPTARAAGISKREIARRTGVSRPWIEHLLREGSDRRSAGDTG
jgi:transcriptional regulator with XRE-family HTH domain